MKEGEIELEISSSYKNLKLIRSIVRSYLEVEKVSKADKVQLISVIDELSTNTVEHAYNNTKGEQNYLNISLNKKENKIFIRVEDFGSGFKEEGNSKIEGGLGLNIVRGIVDHFKLSRKDQGTKIEVYKTVKEED